MPLNILDISKRIGFITASFLLASFLKAKHYNNHIAEKKSISIFTIHDKWKFSNLLSDERVPRQILSAT